MKRAKKAGEDGKLFNTDNVALLKYSHSLDGGGFVTKDFRTLLATRKAMEHVKKADPPKTEEDYKKKVKDIAKNVASVLGNTPAVCLNAYINPSVFTPWRAALEG